MRLGEWVNLSPSGKRVGMTDSNLAISLPKAVRTLTFGARGPGGRTNRCTTRGSHGYNCPIMEKQRPVAKCKLCGLVKELCDSHYLPKRLYAFLRAAQLNSLHPVMEVGGELKQVSVQYRGYVLCAECEDLLNKHGEKWVLANIPQDYDGAFPLQDAINYWCQCSKAMTLFCAMSPA